jgi:glucose-1-phosphate adenylyltransferase
MLASGEKMMSYSFEGYWKDVGTIQSLWEANMDLLGDAPAFSLLDEAWRIYSRHSAQPPQYIAKGAVVENVSVTAGCQIYGTVKNSVLGANVTVGKGAIVEDSVIMNDTVIEDGAIVRYAILDEKVTIGKKATVGAARESGAQIAVVGADVTIQAGEVVAPGAMLSEM